MKYKISVEETLKYDREFTVDIPEDMDEDELDDLLDEAQNQANGGEDFSAIYTFLQSYGIKITEYADDDTHYPQSAEFNIYDMVESGEETENDEEDSK